VKLSEDRLDQIRFGFVAALAMWALCTFSTFVEWIKTNEMFALIKDKHPYVTDFAIYYTAGKLALQAMHTPTNIYDIVLQDRMLKSVIAPVAPEQPWFIQCPPPFFVVAAILPFFSLPVAWCIWVVAGDIFLFWALHYLLKDSLRSRKDFVVLAIAVAASFPFWVCNRMGQAALFTVPAAILLFALLKNGKSVAAGMTTLVLLMKFQYLPFLGLVGAAQGRVKFVVTAIASFAVAVLGSGLVLGMQNIIDYPRALMEGEYKVGVYSGVNTSDQQNLRALLMRLTGADSPVSNRVCIISCFVVALIIFALWLKGLKDVETQNRFKFLATLTICCMLFFSPHTHTQDYLALALPACWIWLETIKAKFSGAKWVKRFVISLPFVSWVMFVVDQLHPVVPPFTILLPLLVYSAYETFCAKGKEAKERSQH
jgi:hypothetical protein